MISFVECSMAIQNVLMILLEICMILELIPVSYKQLTLPTKLEL